MGPTGQRESYLSERICRLSKRICYQLDLGHRCAWPTDATPVDTADAFVQENSSHGRFQYGRRVSICFSHCVRRTGNDYGIHRSNLSNAPSTSSPASASSPSSASSPCSNSISAISPTA